MIYMKCWPLYLAFSVLIDEWSLETTHDSLELMLIISSQKSFIQLMYREHIRNLTMTMTMNIFYCHAYIEVTRHTSKHSR